MKWFVIAALAFFGIRAFAQQSDKMDLQKLEDKYWSAKDTDFTVVQNRLYTKAGRFFASASYGPMINDPNSVGRMTNFSGGYYFSERHGFEIALESGTLKDNDTVNYYVTTAQTKPDHNKFVDYTSINYLFVPAYAKMSFLDRSILYFDLQVGIGVGMMRYEQQHDPNQLKNSTNSAIGYNLDITQQVFFHEHWSVRLDIKNKWTTQKLDRWRTQGGQTRELSDRPTNDTSILLGMTYFF